MKKDIRNTDVIPGKLRPALIRATNHRLKVAREEQRKREEIVEKRKIKTMTARCQRAREGINSSSKKEENYESNTGDKTDPDQAGNDKNSLQL